MLSKYEAKGIAGKIIPAIATTTAIVAGLSILELYKLVMKFESIEAYKSNFLNLAIPYLGSADPIACKHYELKKKKISMWSKYEVHPIKDNNGEEFILKDLISYLEKTYEFTIDLISIDKFIIFSSYIQNENIIKNMNTYISDIINNIMPDNTNEVILMNISIDTEEDIQIPPVLYYIECKKN